MKQESLNQWLEKHPIFKSQDLKTHINSERMTYIELKRLLFKGEIRKLPFNLYVKLNHEQTLLVSVEDIACHISGQAYIVGSYAGRFHGLNIERLETIHIGVERAFKAVEIEGVIFKPKQEPVRPRFVEAEGRRYTDYFDTIIDLIDHLDKWLSLTELLTALKSASTLKSTIILTRLAERNKNMLYQKCGLLVECDLLKVDDQEVFIKICKSNIDQSTRFFSKEAKDKGTYIKKWQLIVPDILVDECKD